MDTQAHKRNSEHKAQFSLSSWSIKNPVPALVIFILLVFAGILAFRALPINNMPDVVVPIVNVTVPWPGANPTVIENQITKILENELAGLEGLKHIYSSISSGHSVTTLEFRVGFDFDRAIADSRDRVARVRATLPADISEPVIERVEIENKPILIYSLTHPNLNIGELSWLIDDSLSKLLMKIPGVGEVTRFGGEDQEIALLLDPAKLAQYQLSAVQIHQQLAKFNIDEPAGKLTLGQLEWQLKLDKQTKTLQELKEFYINLPSGKLVQLQELGTIQAKPALPVSLTRLNREPAVVFALYRSQGYSEIDIERQVDEALAKFTTEFNDNNQDQAKTLAITKVSSLVETTKSNYMASIITFIEGMILTILVVYYFLRNWRATWIAAITIPLSLIPTFMCLHWLGFTINGVTLFAISLVTGVLVDDAIVEIENINRHMLEYKLSPYRAALIAADEISLAVVATTAVICAAFIPVSFMSGISGQYFKQFGLTVAIAAFFSLVVARLLTPMLAAYFLKTPAPDSEQIASLAKTSTQATNTGDHTAPQGWLRHYQRLVTTTLANRGWTLLIALLSLGLSFWLFKQLPSGFIPADDLNQSRLSIAINRGLTLQDTDKTVRTAVELVLKRPEVLRVISRVGWSGSPNNAMLFIKYVPAKQRKLSQQELERQLSTDLLAVADAKFSFANQQGGQDIQLGLAGNDRAVLTKLAQDLATELRRLPELRNVKIEEELQPELLIKPYNLTSSLVNNLAPTLSPVSLARDLSINSIGDSKWRLTKINYGDRQVPIRVVLDPAKANELAAIATLPIASGNGSLALQLNQYAELSYQQSQVQLERYDQLSRISLGADLNQVELGDAITIIKNLPLLKNLPDGINLITAGDAEQMKELFKEFSKAIAISLVLIYLIQVLLYSDWIQPITRMMALPLALGGAFALLLISNNALSMPAIIGILMLMGIADKNSILLVDYMLDLKSQGEATKTAILEACRVRARPIVMTSIAMIAGMIPSALGLSLNSSFRKPMALAVIGGLVSSTVLSLFFIPVIFSYVMDLENWLVPKLKNLVNKAED